MTFKLHASGQYDYLKALKEAHKNLISQVDTNRTLPAPEKKAEIDRLRVEYDRKRKLARFGLF